MEVQASLERAFLGHGSGAGPEYSVPLLSAPGFNRSFIVNSDLQCPEILGSGFESVADDRSFDQRQKSVHSIRCKSLVPVRPGTVKFLKPKQAIHLFGLNLARLLASFSPTTCQTHVGAGFC